MRHFMNKYMGYQRGKRNISTGYPFIQDRTPEQPDHIGSVGLIREGLLCKRHPVIEPGQFKRVFKSQLCEDRVIRKFLDTENDRSRRCPKTFGQALQRFQRELLYSGCIRSYGVAIRHGADMDKTRAL